MEKKKLQHHVVKNILCNIWPVYVQFYVWGGHYYIVNQPECFGSYENSIQADEWLYLHWACHLDCMISFGPWHLRCWFSVTWIALCVHCYKYIACPGSLCRNAREMTFGWLNMAFCWQSIPVFQFSCTDPDSTFLEKWYCTACIRFGVEVGKRS